MRLVYCGERYEKGTYEVFRDRCGELGRGLGLVARHRTTRRWIAMRAIHPGDYRAISHHGTRAMAGAALAEAS